MVPLWLSMAIEDVGLRVVLVFLVVGALSLWFSKAR
jgi:hypothetical protein